APGAMGTFFRTDVHLFNPGTAVVSLELLFTPTDTDGRTSRIRRTLDVGPDAVLDLPDVVSGLFGLASGSGALEVRAHGGHVQVTSRTYNETTAGTFGMYEEAQPLGSAAGTGAPVHLVHVEKSDAFRTNVGFCETAGGALTVTLRLLDAAGAE